MTLPASAPPGLSVARLRAGLGRAAALAAPAARGWAGASAPGEYRSAFPERLRIGRAGIVALALLWLWAGFSGLAATRGIVKVIGHDTAPSVAAAQAIRTGLAAANAQYALAILSSEGTDGPSLSAMRSHLGAVRTALVDAAANITYGEEERAPILRVMQELGSYEELIGWSDARSGAARLDLAFAADDRLQRAALPAAAALERANADHLDADYRTYLGRWPTAWIVASGALLVLLLAAVQVDAARTARRLINPGLLLATLTVVATTTFVVLCLLAAQEDLRVAKLDAFDSVYALSSARALAADADAAQSLRLLAGGDAERARGEQQRFDKLAARLLPVPVDEAIRLATRGKNPGGYLGDELTNVTFDGERDAAVAAARAWGAVRASDRAIRDAQVRGDRNAAVGGKTADRLTRADTVFARFDAALVAVLDINRAAFASAIASAEGDDAPLGAALTAGFAVAAAAAWLGVRQRLDEYRF